MKKTIVMLIIASIVLLSSLGMKTAHAQGDTEIIVMVQNDAACVVPMKHSRYMSKF